MNIIFSELYFKFRTSKFNKLIFIIQFTFCMLLIAFITNEAFIAYSNKKEAEEIFINSDYHIMFDNYVAEKETEFLNEQDSLIRLNKFYKTLMAQTEFKYLVQTKQPLDVLVPIESFPSNTLASDRKFFYMYEAGRSTEPQPYKDDVGNEYILSTLKGLQVNENVLKHYDFKLTEGRLFNTEDYLYKENNIPVLLGSEYKGTYEINDVFKAWHFGTKTFRIIGFLSSSTYIVDNDEPLNVSRYMISPSLCYAEEVKTIDEKNALLNIYLQKLCGVLVSEKNSLYLSKIVDDLCDQLGLLHYSIGNNVPSMASILSIEFNIFMMLMCIFLLVILTFSVIGFSLNLISKLREDTINFIPYLLSGMGIYNLKCTIIIEVIVLFLISALFTMLLVTPIFMIPQIYGTIGILSFGIITTLVLYIMLKQLDRVDLSQFLKVDE